MMKNLLHVRFLSVLLMAAVLGGCSFKSMYNQLDWLMLGMVEDFVTLNEDQEQDVSRRIQRLLDWHRTEQIPLYIQDLQRIKSSTATGLTEESAEGILDLFMQRWTALKSRVATDMAETLVNMDEKQKSEIYTEIENRNREIREEYAALSEKEREHRIGDRIIENFERWLGDLNEVQKKIVREQITNIKPIHEERLAFRSRWQQGFREVMDSDLDKPAKVARLNELFANPEHWQSAAYKEKLSHNSRQVRRLVLSVDRTLTPEQKAHLQERLDYFIQILKDISNGN